MTKIVSKICNLLVLALIMISLGGINTIEVFTENNFETITLDNKNKVIVLPPNSAAAKSGIKLGDTIVATYDIQLQPNNSSKELVITENLELTISRDGKTIQKKIISNSTQPTSSSTTTCSVSKSEIRWYSIATPASFLPIIPASCAQKDGNIQPLSLTIIPEIILRLFGFIISLVWILLLPTIIFAGIWYTWGGIDGTSSEAAKRLLQNALLSLLSLFFFFVIVFSLIGILGGDRLLGTNLSDIFN